MPSESDEPDGWDSLSDDAWARLDEQCHGYSERQAVHLTAEARRGLHAPWCPTPRSGCVCDAGGIGY
jgi:hypothetical protein